MNCGMSAVVQVDGMDMYLLCVEYCCWMKLACSYESIVNIDDIDRSEMDMPLMLMGIYLIIA